MLEPFNLLNKKNRKERVLATRPFKMREYAFSPYIWGKENNYKNGKGLNIWRVKGQESPRTGINDQKVDRVMEKNE